MSKAILMQDGAPCHTAKSVEQFILNEKIPLPLCPGYPPVINSIENVKAKVCSLGNLLKEVLIQGIVISLL